MTSRIRSVMMRRVWRIPLVFLLIIVIGVSIVAGVIASIPKSTVDDLRFEFWTDKETYGVNETITGHMKIINPTLSQVRLDFTSSFQFDYIIFDQNNTQLYKWSDDKVFLAALTEIYVSPLSSYKKIFNHLPRFYLLQPGTYTIRGIVVGYFSKDTTIEISET